MEITKNKVVSIDYTLKNDNGDVIDTSDGRGPLVYLQGHENIIPGLEKELEGKATGDALEVRIAPEDAYGVRNDGFVQKMPSSAFEGIEKIEVGMQFQMQAEQGQLIVTVTEVSGDEITVDGNHPLAGEHLNFSVKVAEIREATEEEIAHGHVHGPGGHNH